MGMELIRVFLHALNIGLGSAGFPLSLHVLALTPPGNKEHLWAESSAGEGEQMESCSLWSRQLPPRG